VFAGSDYLNINFDDITNPEDGYDFEDDAETFPKNNNKNITTEITIPENHQLQGCIINSFIKLFPFLLTIEF
jgi:hypothetical protein